MSNNPLKKALKPLHGVYVELMNDKLYRQNRKLALSGHPEEIVRRMYFNAFGKMPDLDNPKTFNEKLQWLKLYWYDERARICASKHLVRDYVAEKGLADTLIEQYGVYKTADEIDFEALPNQFVLKPSHDSGHIIICKDKQSFDRKKAVSDLNKWMKTDYEFMSGEWQYHGERVIVCEKYMEDKKAGELLDYKFFCFSGKPELCFFCSDRRNHVKSDFYDMDWNLQPFRWLYEPSGKVFPKPENFEMMKKYAEILSEGFPEVRVDFYEIEGKIYFGELTFFHGGGLGWFKPEQIDYDLGEKIILPEKASPTPWERIIEDFKK